MRLSFSAPSTRSKKLMEMLHFAHHEVIDSDRLLCAYEFINNSGLTAELQRLDAIKMAYGEGDTLCQVSPLLRSRLADVPYKMSLMFEIDSKC